MCDPGLREELEAMVENLHRNIGALLRNVGDPGKCKGCGRDIYWVMHNNARKAPYTADGLNHFANCPKADDFRRPK